MDKAQAHEIRGQFQEKVFICPGKCGECTKQGHACGNNDTFKSVKIVIPAHWMKNTILILITILFLAIMPLECVSVSAGSYSQISFNYFQFIGLIIVYLFWKLLKKINNYDDWIHNLLNRWNHNSNFNGGLNNEQKRKTSFNSCRMGFCGTLCAGIVF